MFLDLWCISKSYDFATPAQGEPGIRPGRSSTTLSRYAGSGGPMGLDRQVVGGEILWATEALKNDPCAK